MLIAESRSRWYRDSVVADLIEHMDSIETKALDSGTDPWELLSSQELKAVESEIRKCRNDFVYAARNYFWIADDKGVETPFCLWDSQELIYARMMELKAKKKAQKVAIIKSRRLGCCLDPNTKILTADLRWISLDDVLPGQELVSIDELRPGGQGRQRKLRKCVVLAKRDVYEPAYKLTMDNGETLIATAEHRFLCKRRTGTEAIWVSVRKQGRTKSRAPIIVGDEIRWIVDPWRQEQAYEDGWFGGMIDGEGNMRARHRQGCELNISQTENDAQKRAIKYVQDEGYKFQLGIESRDPNKSKDGCTRKPLTKVIISGISEIFKVLGITRPSRFINNNAWWEGKTLPKTGSSWRKVVSIEELPVQRMVDLQTSTKTFIANGFVSHNSTLIEGLIAWDTMFFTNRTAVVVSYDRDHTKDLLGIMLRIYDKCPWWIKPRVSSRTFEGGLVFDNPNHDLRRHDPGTQSKVMLKSANSINGVGQGYRISSAHLSEWTSYVEHLARVIIEEDLAYALQPDSFAFLESTAKGANNFSHRFWRRCEELEEESQWSPLFLPWFVDRTHVAFTKNNQYLEPQVLSMRDNASDHWVRCTDDKCKKYFNRWKRRVDQSMSECPSCHIGLLEPLYLTDEQLMWMQHLRNNAKDDEESQKNLAQEQCSTAEESFQVTGYQVFGKAAQDFATSAVKPPILVGFFDNYGRIHAVDPKRAKLDETTGDILPSSIFCIQPDCKEDHTHDTCPLRIWEYPDPTATYYLGADVSEGLGGNCDYSVGTVIRMSGGASIGPTYQVATWRSNRTGTQDFAEELAKLGRYYNEAEISVEVNKYDTVLTWLRSNIQYPNLYRWKHMDSINPMSNKLGWYTNQLSRPRLHQNFRRFLEYKMFYVRSSNAAEEMKNFVKDDYDDRMAGADSDSHDDEILSLMISLWCAYEGMFDETRGYIPLSKQSQPEECAYLVQCVVCGHKDYTNFIPMEGEQNIKCGNEKCKSIRVVIQPTKAFKGIKADPKQMLEDIGAWERERGATPEYWEL